MDADDAGMALSRRVGVMFWPVVSRTPQHMTDKQMPHIQVECVVKTASH